MALDEQTPSTAGFREAFLAHEREVRISTGKLACALVFFLMPFGVTLDYFVYRDHVLEFLKLRLLCSLIITGVWALHWTPLAKRHYPVVGLPIVILPSFFITVMIFRMDAVSPYYAGLNLVLLAVSAVGHWSMLETLLAVGSVTLMYLVAYVARSPSPEEFKFFYNNLYFLALTGIIVTSGNYMFNRLRFREFVLRFELDQNRRQLEETNQKLKELDQIKGRFFANISHELRTPLTLMLSPLETLLHSPDYQFNPEARNLMSIMHGNGMRLLKLINDLLDLVRLESGRMEVKREPVEMTAFLKGLCGAPQQMAQAKDLALETIVEPEVGPLLVDRDKLEKTVLNLVFNALKFTPAKGSVTVRTRKQDERLIITVADTGVGISEKNLPFVFDRFWQADNSSKRKYQGVGIGLSLVKELTEIQGGTVSVVSQEGHGTTFTVDLPFISPEAGVSPEESDGKAAPAAVPETATAQSTTVASAAPAQSGEWLSNLYRRAELFPASISSPGTVQHQDESRNGDRPTVLVADDEPDMLRFLESQLVSHYRVVEAVDGLQAFQKAGESLPDLILLDMNMPEKDGLQVCRELRTQESTREIPVIILTARADEETKLTCLSAGANDFLTKPFSASELHVRIRNLVQSHHYREKLAGQNRALESAIEQLKETESLLVQTEKMASLGRMSAGIIHEINNPLNYATTGLYTLRGRAKLLAPEHQSEYVEILHDVEEGLKRVRNIVTGLRTFTHPDTEQVDDVEVAATMAFALKFLASEWREKVQIEQNFEPGLVIRGNRNKLLQVFVNLLQNSLDATRRRKTYGEEQPAIKVEGRLENDKTVVIVRDNGEGIAAEDVDKVFDPFFTTKDVGEGMGLGLSISYRIVEDYDGRITVRSEQGKFCEFRLEFPVKR
jgi:signal transduction histidine kinase